MGRNDYRGCPKDVVEYLDGLRDKVNIKAVLLFDSRARGDHGPTSDFELFVIADDLPLQLRERLDLLYEEIPAGVDVLGFTEDEVRKSLSDSIA